MRELAVRVVAWTVAQMPEKRPIPCGTNSSFVETAMHYLERSKVRRGGVSTGYVSDERTDISIAHDKDAWGNVFARFDFQIASKGGGTTHVVLDIHPSEFKSVIETFVKCDRVMSLQIICEMAAQLLAEESKRLKELDQKEQHTG